ncbi:MAG: hypothetical protein LIO99_07975 [Clostridiales bacterium]|nr:hypothetical protein [Clostridiales bacterium]
MRLRGIRKNLYLMVGSRPELNRKILRLHHSFEEVLHLLEKGSQKK